MKAKYTIAECDILGFSSIVERASLDDIVNDALTWLSKALHHSLHGGNFPDGSMTLQSFKLIQMSACLGFPIPSCSSHAATITTVYSLFSSVLAGSCSKPCTSARFVSDAAFSYGEAFIDPENSLFVGLPIAR